ncbi:STAS domain-containing protein [Wenjunlia tyrosinilytica]|uniref:Anti-sigma factor antagonist n=1 Tax=Wenjunlia tyrosinilytica TaxID=1544741 RepID=A0A917ZXL5_9ACTN|nr:STAS domain-containing protein [Wenjunlia tyrosinilytica]GGP00419.1 hypothetical protein GCM10012280_69140 [Wenjunlia tyrosinilytica]
MPIPQTLNVYRHDRATRALITLAGEIDMDSAPLVRALLRQCLRDGIRTVDIDLTTVTFCDCSGLGAFLEASHHVAAAGGTLRLHHPSPALARLFTLTGTGPLLGLPAAPGLPVFPGELSGSAPTAQLAPFGEAVPGLAPVVPAVLDGVR